MKLSDLLESVEFEWTEYGFTPSGVSSSGWPSIQYNAICLLRHNHPEHKRLITSNFGEEKVKLYDWSDDGDHKQISDDQAIRILDKYGFPHPEVWIKFYKKWNGDVNFLNADRLENALNGKKDGYHYSLKRVISSWALGHTKTP